MMQLRSELREKEMKLTDIRLEALSSAHQLDQLREAMNRMQVCTHTLNQTKIKGMNDTTAKRLRSNRLRCPLVVPADLSKTPALRRRKLAQ